MIIHPNPASWNVPTYLHLFIRAVLMLSPFACPFVVSSPPIYSLRKSLPPHSPIRIRFVLFRKSICKSEISLWIFLFRFLEVRMPFCLCKPANHQLSNVAASFSSDCRMGMLNRVNYPAKCRCISSLTRRIVVILEKAVLKVLLAALSYLGFSCRLQNFFLHPFSILPFLVYRYSSFSDE
jgi:hypothetical protein